MVVMSENKQYTIRKIEAAIRQLDVAIQLWFNEGDEIAIHTLACSAHQIINDINCHKKGANLLFNHDRINDKYRGIAIRHFKKHYNFFKHADDDPNPEGTIEFTPILTEGFILYSILGLESFKIKISFHCSAFLFAFSVYNPELITGTLKLFIDSIPIERLNEIRKFKRLHLLSCFSNTQNYISLFHF
jgi:hypothetical protein